MKKKEFIFKLVKNAIRNQLYLKTDNSVYRSSYNPKINLDVQAKLCTASIIELLDVVIIAETMINESVNQCNCNPMCSAGDDLPEPCGDINCVHK